MSFILDALKKSEHERQRQSMPGLVESGPVRTRPTPPMWAVGLYVLLGITVILLAVVVARSLMTSAPQASRTARTKTHASADGPDAAHDDSAAVADRHFSPLDPSPVYAPEIPVTAGDGPTLAPALATLPAASGRTSTGGTGSMGPTVRRREAVNKDDYKASDAEVLPSINELNLTGAQALPELHLDVHVFATQAADRFVFINMRKYHEGAVLQEGPTLERIRRDGVILDYNGLRFLLPRQ